MEKVHIPPWLKDLLLLLYPTLMQIQVPALTKQERTAKIGEIVEKVTQMTDEQLGNVHEYISDEFEEPNHEAEALNAVIRLSRKYGKNKDKVR